MKKKTEKEILREGIRRMKVEGLRSAFKDADKRNTLIESMNEGTKRGDDVEDPLVKGEKGYSAYGEQGASGGSTEVDDAEDLFEDDKEDDDWGGNKGDESETDPGHIDYEDAENHIWDDDEEEDLEGLAALAIAAVHKLATAAGIDIDTTVDTGEEEDDEDDDEGGE